MKPVIVLLMSFAFTGISFGQEKQELFDSLFNTLHERGQFHGNVLISENDRITYSKSFGFADREKEVLLNEETLFNVGSVSKAFTAIAILQLSENGNLKLSDKVVDYLSEFPYQDISIHHLLIHAGGLPNDYALQNRFDNNKIATNDDAFKLLYDLKPPLIFTPGERSEYSNMGYMVLAEIVRKVSGIDFQEYLQKYVFNPANMHRTKIYNADEITKVDNVAKGYVYYPFTGQYEEAIKVPEFSSNYVISGFQGDGNVHSTTLDLYNFYFALKNEVLINKKTFESVFQKHIHAQMAGTPDFGNSYGYGWLILNAPKFIVSRGGELQGYVSNTIWNITDDRLIIYLMNDYLSYTSYHNQIPLALGEILNNNNIQIPKLVASVELTKMMVTRSPEEIRLKIKEIKNRPDIYQIDPPGLKFLVMKLDQMGDERKVEVLKSGFGME